jgi:hypothetical protein
VDLNPNMVTRAKMLTRINTRFATLTIELVNLVGSPMDELIPN